MHNDENLEDSSEEQNGENDSQQPADNIQPSSQFSDAVQKLENLVDGLSANMILDDRIENTHFPFCEVHGELGACMPKDAADIKVASHQLTCPHFSDAKPC
jgi:hypothetical protein